jgi:pimeloyl-ACP methyl ester carboxylesterase
VTHPLVLLPGMNCSARLWGGAVDELQARTGPMTVVHGRLDRATIDDCVTALLTVLPPRFALAGLSLGGIVAMALTRRAPERVTRLCLMSTNPHGPTPQQRRAWADQRADLAAGRSACDLQRELLPVLVHARTPVLDAEVLAMADEVGASVLDAQLAAQASRIDERPGLMRVGVPTSVVAAAQDRLCPPARHEEIHALVPGSRLTVLDGVGHLSTMEDPARVGGVLADWLGSDG